jgi:hypothetical protein
LTCLWLKLVLVSMWLRYPWLVGVFISFYDDDSDNGLWDHQRVATTRWCVLCFSQQQRQPSTATATTNESRRLVGVFIPFYHDDDGLWDHQRVMTTRWCVLFFLRQWRRPLRPPTSHDDSLVCAFLFTTTTTASETTNESWRLVGVFFSSYDNDDGHQHERHRGARDRAGEGDDRGRGVVQLGCMNLLVCIFFFCIFSAFFYRPFYQF